MYKKQKNEWKNEFAENEAPLTDYETLSNIIRTLFFKNLITRYNENKNPESFSL